MLVNGSLCFTKSLQSLVLQKYFYQITYALGYADKENTVSQAAPEDNSSVSFFGCELASPL